MENRTQRPNSYAFYNRLYNANFDGRWVDLINRENNKEHAGSISMFNESIYQNVYNINLCFLQGADFMRTRIKINGKEFLLALLLEPKQFQSDMVQLAGYYTEITELKIFIPYQTYSVDVIGFVPNEALKLLGGWSSEPYIPNQHCTLLKNNSSNIKRVDLLNLPENDPDSALTYTQYYKELFQVLHYKVFSSHMKNIDHRFDLVYKNGPEQTFMSGGITHDQFQNKLIERSIVHNPIDFSELSNFFVEIYPGEEALFYFYN